MSSISIFHIGFVICLSGAILFFVISAVLFFVFDIRTIFAIRSGRAQAKTVKEMEMVNSSTGRLRPGKKNSSRESSQKKNTKKQERRAPAVQPPVAVNPAAQAQDAAADYEEGVTEKLVPDAAPNNAVGTDETVLLSEVGETAVLSTTDDYAAPPVPQAAAAPVVQNNAPVYFEIVKKIICLDTDEVIS